MISRQRPTRNASVSQDWRKFLSDEKSFTYLITLRQLETAYSMFSVNLDEALGMRRGGRFSKAYQVLHVSPALCQRLTAPLLSLLRAMLEHGKHFGITPNLVPLDPENFQNSRSQRVARFNDLLSMFLLTRKSQFLHKISALAELVEELGKSFESAAGELGEGESLHPDHDWDMLDAIHYDLNTCLRESVVLMKSFLHALPEGQLHAFAAKLRDFHLETPFCSRAPVRHLAHRCP